LPPNPSGAPWARLATGAREVADIARLFPAGEATALVGNAATEVAAKRGRGARYLHFAVHGWIDDRRPERSGLVLAPSQGEDGMLRVAEIAALRVPARLAVLAACDTGLGPELRGEGVLGLTRAFLNAGLEQVVVTLWPVSDQSTGRLMPQFYKELLGGARAGAALRSAQLAMLADPATSHPYHWASFVVNGDSPRR
jgi:CHAT domain-containing protein